MSKDMVFEIGDVVEYTGIVPECAKNITFLTTLKENTLYTIRRIVDNWCSLEEDPYRWIYPMECFSIPRACVKKKYDLR